jgi:hypothetical protein
METTGATEIEKLRVEIQKNADIYTILEEEKYRLEPVQIENRWRVFRQPKDTYTMMQ